MKSKKKNIVIITNLYPLPWEPNRATFNRQQFTQLDDEFNRHTLVPVAFSQWFKYRKTIKQSDDLRFVPYFYLPKVGRRFYSVFLFISILLHSGAWIKKIKPDIIFASWAFPEAVAASWLSILFKCHFYFKVHGSDINLHGKIPARAKQIVKASKRALGILSVSKALAKQMVEMGVEKSKIKVIYNGVDHQLFTQEILPSGNDLNLIRTPPEPYILFVGNVKKEKGVIELIDGFAQIANDFPKLQLIYAGPGALTDLLKNKAHALNLKHRVQLLGSIDHNKLPALMANADLLALPSYNEGVPNVVLEAMASGIPVLATQVGGIPEVVDESFCGRLIPAQDNKAVATGLKYILTHQWDHRKIKHHSQKFSWPNNKKQLLALLNQ